MSRRRRPSAPPISSNRARSAAPPPARRPKPRRRRWRGRGRRRPGRRVARRRSAMPRWARPSSSCSPSPRLGFGKRSSSYQFRVSGRGGKGIRATDPTKLKEIGTLVAAFPVEMTDQIMLVSNGGQLIRVPVEGIRFTSRASKGVRVFNTAEGERVVSVERLSVGRERRKRQRRVSASLAQRQKPAPAPPPTCRTACRSRSSRRARSRAAAEAEARTERFRHGDRDRRAVRRAGLLPEDG